MAILNLKAASRILYSWWTSIERPKYLYAPSKQCLDLLDQGAPPSSKDEIQLITKMATGGSLGIMKWFGIKIYL